MLLGIGTPHAMAEETLPDIELNVPENQVYRDYLGLHDHSDATFHLSEVKADVLLIELFSMYCPYCQKEAPAVNRLYEKMQAISRAGMTVKMVGLGAGNSAFEVEHFRETYNIEFPLFPDPELVMYKSLQGAGTPGFIGCRLQTDQQPVIVLRNSGGFYSVDDFLQELLKKSGYDNP